MLKKVITLVLLASFVVGTPQQALGASKKTVSAKVADGVLKKAYNKTAKLVNEKAIYTTYEELNNKGVTLKEQTIKIDDGKNFYNEEIKGKDRTETALISNQYYMKDTAQDYAEYELTIAKELGIDLSKKGFVVSLNPEDLENVDSIIDDVRKDAAKIIPWVSPLDIEKKYPKSTYSYTKNKNTETVVIRKVSKTPSTAIYTISEGAIIRFVEFDKKLKPLKRYSFREYGAKVRVTLEDFVNYSNITSHPLYKNQRDTNVARVWLEKYFKEAFAIAAFGSSAILTAKDLLAATEGYEGVTVFETAIELTLDSPVDNKEFTVCGYYLENNYQKPLIIENKGCLELGFKKPVIN